MTVEFPIPLLIAFAIAVISVLVIDTYKYINGKTISMGEDEKSVEVISFIHPEISKKFYKGK